MPEFGTVDLDPLEPVPEPCWSWICAGAAGPIMVMIDYQIHPTDIHAFLGRR